MTKNAVKLSVTAFAMLLLSGAGFIQSCRKTVVDKAAGPAADQATFSIARLSLATGAAPLRVFTLAGSSSGFANGTLTAAQFRAPGSIAVDAIGNTYIADRDNNMIRKVTSAGVVTTYAGQITPGFTNGAGTAASFRTPTGVAIDAAGILYVADSGNHVIRKITPPLSFFGTPEVTTLAGTGEAGFTEEGPAAAAQFNGPASVAVDASGTNVYVTDVLNVRIRKISAGFVFNFAGNGQTGNNPDSSSIPGRVASFNAPAGLAVDRAGNIFLADVGNNRIRKITPAGVVSPAAGNLNGNSGNTDGDLTTATFNAPTGVAVDTSGAIYVADRNNHRIRKVILSNNGTGMVNTLTGSIFGFLDGLAGVAQFKSPVGVAVDAKGIVYVADQENNRVREIVETFLVSTQAGNGTAGFGNGSGSAVMFNGPLGLATDAAGNIYVADRANNRIRKITPTGVVSTFAGSGVEGRLDGPGNTAQFKWPYGLAVDNAGNVYVAEYGNYRIRKITQAGTVSTLAGNIQGHADGQGANALFSAPRGITVDLNGNLFVTDGNSIRKVTPGGLVSTLTVNFATVPGDSFLGLWGIALDNAMNLYVVDQSKHRIRKIILSADGTGTVTTLAGGSAQRGNDDGTGSLARFAFPSALAIDASGNLYVADTENHNIRKVTPTGVVTTIAANALPSWGGDMFGGGYLDGVARIAQFHFPRGITVDASGTVYVGDYTNNRIRKIQ
jgi:sugar lactone lactonase YvrE